jgi:Flp pilus assembly protein CpaB
VPPTNASSAVSWRENSVDSLFNRKNRKTDSSSYLILAGVSAIVAAGAWKFFSQPSAEKMVDVVVIREGLPAGSRLTYDAIGFREIPEKNYSERMFKSIDHLVGRFSKENLIARDPVLTSDLLPEGETPDRQIPTGYRTITLNLQADGLVDFSVRPGDHVDVIAITASAGKKYSKVVCQDVLVVAAMPKERALTDDDNPARWQKATLQADADSVETLAEAAETSKLRLVLRNPNDHAFVISNGKDERDLLPSQALVPPPQAKPLAPQAVPPPVVKAPPLAVLPPPAPPPLPTWDVEIYRGNVKSVQQFVEPQAPDLSAQPSSGGAGVPPAATTNGTEE